MLRNMLRRMDYGQWVSLFTTGGHIIKGNMVGVCSEGDVWCVVVSNIASDDFHITVDGRHIIAAERLVMTAEHRAIAP